ncbi:MAG: choloylglycine hydrolase [Candidatus Onthovivens sp.]|nr:choloylglycine hydrolase [Candidatus Onthovivens sp.]
MCTGLFLKTNNSYFGRNLDLNYSYDEEVSITSRNFDFKFRYLENISKHYAIIGMAFNLDNYPLFYEASNEKGLAIVGLNFPNNTYFNKVVNKSKINLCQFEFIPYLLSTCKNVKEVVTKLKKINVVDTPFKEGLLPAPLHYLISDLNDNSITVELDKDGLKIYKNKYGVLTNNPPFKYQVFNLNNYVNVTNKVVSNRFNKKLRFETYCFGLGGIGLPGDNSSMSRFVRTVFNKFNLVCDNDELSSINGFFKILDNVSQIKGVVKADKSSYEMTLYSSCINLNEGIYYYKTYLNHQISAIKLFNHDLDNDKVYRYPLINKENINYQN